MDAQRTFLTGQAGIAQAAKLLAEGQCVAVPTETVYGLAANAFDERAVRDVFAIKNRPFIDPLIVHVAGPAKLLQLTAMSPAQEEAARQLAAAFWPGPLTLVLPKQADVPDLVTANRDSVAVRCPAHPIMHELLEQSGLFLAAPSANPFGYISPTTAQHVADSLGERCPHILDGGPCERGVESTIVDLREPDLPRLLRPGPIGQEALEKALGREIHLPEPKADASLAPGMLERHYSPSTRLQLHATGELSQPGPDEAAVYLKRPAQAGEPRIYWLSESGALEEAAANLFTLLRQLDARPEIAVIHCELPEPGPGVASAIRDRLTRASKR